MKTLIWQGTSVYQSLEYFTIQDKDDHYLVKSQIIGCYQNQIYTVSYNLIIDKGWTILEFLIESEINTIKNKMTGKRHQNEWEINNTINPQFKDFTFIDISLTPFTNTLPVNNLQLLQNNAKEINVIYIDVLNNHIKPVKQQYTRTSSYEYLYENLQNDFKANVLFDEKGFVIDYPELFKKVAEL